MEQGAELWHGTINGYRGRGCRCNACCSASSAANKKRHDEFKEWLAEVKNQPCTDCGNKYPTVCMDLDHRDPAVKSFLISSSAMRSREALLAEATKCDVVCANCHRIRSAQQKTDGIVAVGRPRRH